MKLQHCSCTPGLGSKQTLGTQAGPGVGTAQVPGGHRVGWEPSESGPASRRPPPLPSSSPFGVRIIKQLFSCGCSDRSGGIVRVY